MFDEGEPDVIRQAGSVFDTAEVLEWVKRVHTPAKANFKREKLIELKVSWGLAPASGIDHGVPQPGRPAEIYRSGGSLLDPAPYLPVGDESFEAWVERAGEALGGAFGLQAPCIECASWDALERLRTLLAPILAITGPRSFRYNVFAGDYRRTPFGYHVDPHQEAVFQVVLRGRRRARFWEGLALSEDQDDAWLEDSNRLQEPGREPDAVFDLEPGDIVFWPGTQVHGMDVDGPSLALSIVIDRASPRRRDDVASGLQIASMQGVAAVPPVVDAPPVTAEHNLRRRSAMRLAYERHDDTLILGVCGRTLDWPDRNSIPDAIELLDHLATQQEVQAGEVARRYAGEALEEQDILTTLTMLVELGYLAAV
jgi:hypothetical protein